MSEMFSKVEVDIGVAVLASVYGGLHRTFIQRRLECRRLVRQVTPVEQRTIGGAGRPGGDSQSMRRRNQLLVASLRGASISAFLGPIAWMRLYRP